MQNSQPSIPFLYRLFFLYIEPVATFLGAYFAYVRPYEYLSLTHQSSAPLSPSALPLGTQIALAQLANMYNCLCMNEALVLRATSDIRVWKTFLFGLLVADLGHLYSVSPLGLDIFWDVKNWNAIDYGNIGFVYIAALFRICFLLSLGLSKQKPVSKRA